MEQVHERIFRVKSKSGLNKIFRDCNPFCAHCSRKIVPRQDRRSEVDVVFSLGRFYLMHKKCFRKIQGGLGKPSKVKWANRQLAESRSCEI